MRGWRKKGDRDVLEKVTAGSHVTQLPYNCDIGDMGALSLITDKCKAIIVSQGLLASFRFKVMKACD